MSTANHLLALLKSHVKGDDQQFLSVAMQIAAHQARLGHTKLAQQLKDVIRNTKRARSCGSSALDRLRQDGLKASNDAIAALIPYQTEHINRFGNYVVNFNRAPEPLPVRFRKPAATEQKGQTAFDYASTG